MSQPAPATRPRSELLWLLTALAIFAAAAVWYNLVRSMWLDEYFTWSRTGVSFGETLEHAYFTSSKPPVYFVAVHWWRVFSDSIEWIRFLSTAALLGTLVALHRLSRTLTIPADWRGVALLAALTPHFFYVGAEARVYALCLLFISWAMYWWARIWVAGAPKPGWAAAGFVLASYLGILTFYYTGFVVAGLLIAAFVYPERRVYAFRAGAALTALLIPWLPLVAVQVSGQGTYLRPIAAKVGLLSKLASTAQYLGSQLLDTVFRLAPVRDRLEFVAVVGLGLLAVLVARLGLSRPRWTRTESKVALAALIAVGSLLGLRTLNQVHADVRHWVVIVPGLLTLVAVVISRVEHARLRTALNLGVVGVFALSALSFVRNERGSYDFRAAANAVMAAERPGEPILSFDGNPGPFLYYYHGPNIVRRVPADLAITRRDYAFTPEEAGRVASALSHAAPPERAFWLVEKHYDGYRFEPGIEVIDRYHPDSVVVRSTTQVHLLRAIRAALVTPSDTGGTPAGEQ
ncbi:MAG: glycosyltransferase family 39 protein [Gemmatimonadales bacterium]